MRLVANGGIHTETVLAADQALNEHAAMLLAYAFSQLEGVMRPGGMDDVLLLVGSGDQEPGHASRGRGRVGERSSTKPLVPAHANCPYPNPSSFTIALTSFSVARSMVLQ